MTALRGFLKASHLIRWRGWIDDNIIDEGFQLLGGRVNEIDLYDRCSGWLDPGVGTGRCVLDLSTVTCQQFIDGDKDEISMVLTWLDGWYKGDEDEAIIDTDVFVTNAKKFGTFCAANPNISVVNAAEKILGK
jgi:acid stress chaperone HdeB